MKLITKLFFTDKYKAVTKPPEENQPDEGYKGCKIIVNNLGHNFSLDIQYDFNYYLS